MQKVCVVTGGANGIGRCITEEFIKNGYFAAVIDTDSVSGEKLLAKYGAKNVLFFCGDIAEQSALDGFFAQIAARHSGVDALINNACITRGGLLSCGYDDFNYVLRIGVTAPFYLTRLLLPCFREGASVVNISSTRAQMSQPDTESYTAAKGGISALTHALCVTLAGKVRVNSVSPGWIETGAYQRNEAFVPTHTREDRLQHPSGRVGVPQDIAQIALFLCSERAGFINGENITVDGGMTKQMIYHNDHGWFLRPEAGV